MLCAIYYSCCLDEAFSGFLEQGEKHILFSSVLKLHA